MPQVDADRNLLFGVLARQLELIDDRQFTDGCVAWTMRKDSPFADLLADRGWITAEDRKQIEALLARKLKKHGGDARATLGTAADARAREVIGLVDDPDIRRSLGGLPPITGHVLVETLPPPSGQPRSRYSLSRLHAEGGLGQVWVARDNDLNRAVALKEIRPERLTHPEACHRFLREAQITGQLEHPNIVPVYELARRPEDGQPFYTMRFVRGQTLREAIAEHHRHRLDGKVDPLEAQRLLQAFVGVCQAVGYAHARGVVHRDLKPDNVVLGGFGEVIVLDWGLAKLVRHEEPEEEDSLFPNVEVGEESQLDETRPGQQLGTPAYMAPEQAAGRLEMIDARTDVYGLGAILFEVVTGRPPHEGDSLDRVLARIAEAETPRARSIEPSVPLPLDAICARAMAHNRADRYAKALDLAEDVRRWMADEPVSAYPEGRFERLARWTRRHRTAVRTAAVVLVAGGLFATAAKLATDARLGQLQVDAEALVDRGDAALWQGDPAGARVPLAAALAKVGGEPRLAAVAARARRLQGEAERRVELEQRRLRDRARFEEFQKHYDGAILHGTLLTGLREGLEQSKSAARRALGVFQLEDTADAAAAIASIDIEDRQRRRIAVGCYEMLLVLARAEALGGREPAGAGTAAATRLIDRAALLVPGTHAARIWRAGLVGPGSDTAMTNTPGSRSGIDDLATAADHFLVGITRYDDEDPQRAIVEFDAALMASPDHFWAEYFLALCRLKLRRWAEAKASLNACLARRPDLAWAYVLRGHASGELRGFEVAEADFARAQELWPDGYPIYVNRGAMRVRQGRMADAIDDLRHAIALAPDGYAAYVNLAHALQTQGRLTEALAQLDRAIELAPGLAALRLNRARLLLERGAPDDARRDLDEAVRLEPPDRPFALRLRAEANLARRRYREALHEFDRFAERGTPDASFYQGRGLARALLGEYPEAVDDYNRSIDLEPSTNVHARRGWAYVLRGDDLGRREFERAVTLSGGKNLEAHAGLGFVLARQGHYRQAIEEAERARPDQMRDWPMLQNVACVYAQAAGKAQADIKAKARDREAVAGLCRDRAVALLRRALDQVGDPRRRGDAWRAMAADPALDPIRDDPGFVALEKEFGRVTP